MRYNPGEYLRKVLGRDNLVFTINGKEIDLEEEAEPPKDDDLEEANMENVERTLTWRAMNWRAQSEVARLQDELKEMEATRFNQYYQQFYTEERKEYDQFLHDEGEPKDPFRRRQKAADRLALGSHVGRFRPSVTDERIRNLAYCEPKCVTARQALRAAQEVLNITTHMVAVFEQRRWAIQGLSTLHRDDHRR